MALLMKDGALLIHNKVDGVWALTEDEDLCDCECGAFCPPSSSWSGVTATHESGSSEVELAPIAGRGPGICNGDPSPVPPVRASQVWYAANSEGTLQFWAWTETIDPLICPDGIQYHAHYADCRDPNNIQNQHTSACCDPIWNGTDYVLNNAPWLFAVHP